jgi:hypothetical protein
MNEMGKKETCDYNKNLDFIGIITKTERFEDNEDTKDKYFDIEITINNSKTETLQFALKYQNDLKAFAHLKQRVIKSKNSPYIIFIDSLNNIKTYRLPGCETTLY